MSWLLIVLILCPLCWGFEACYDLTRDSLVDSNGGAALEVIGGTATFTGSELYLPAGVGLRSFNFPTSGEYTLMMDFSQESNGDLASVVSFNLTSDEGFYLRWFSKGADIEWLPVDFASPNLTEDTYYRFVFQRYASRVMITYIECSLQQDLNLTDSLDYFTPPLQDGVSFFKDNAADNTINRVRSIRYWDRVLSKGDVERTCRISSPCSSLSSSSPASILDVLF